MVTKAAVLIRHHHLTLFWKYSAHRGRWALNKMREGGKQRTKLPLLECDDHMPRVSREATDILLSKNKTKQNPKPEKLRKVFGYRETGNL